MILMVMGYAQEFKHRGKHCGIAMLDVDAERVHHIQRHADVPLALQRGGGDDNRGPVQQRQGHEQAGKKLAGHIPRQAVLPRRQPALHREDAVPLFIPDALLIKQVKVGLLGPLHEPPLSGEDPAAPEGQGDGDEETEGGSRFPAVELRQSIAVCFQLLHTPPGGSDVLGAGQIVYDAALPPPKRRR